MEKIEFNIPKGYVIDLEASTANKIVYKFERIFNSYKDIKGFKDALEYLGKEDHSEWYKSNPDQSKVKQSLALYKLEIIIEAINKIKNWEPNWNDPNQKKYITWFVLDSSFQFDGTYCQYTHANAGCASRLHLPSYEIAEYVGKEFIDLWKAYMN